MEIRRIDTAKSIVNGFEIEGEEMYEGPISEEESALLLKDTRAFLDKAGIKVPKDARIEVSTEFQDSDDANLTVKTKSAPTKQEYSDDAGTGTSEARVVGVGRLCRVTIIVIGGVVIVRVRCRIVIVIRCW